MYEQNYQEILSLVQTPTRYAGNEVNAVRKEPGRIDLTFALVFPDLYEIGTSHFGLQILYSILNHRENIAAERFFTPAPDMEALMRERQIPCLSMESRRPLADFDLIGVSLLYELNFTNILSMFSLSGIPFFAADRPEDFPLVIGGGPCAFNPEPLADFFDLFVIGDGERAVLEIADTVTAFKNSGGGSKKELLRLLSKLSGVYVPCFFDPGTDENGIQTLTPLYEDYTTVRRAFLPDLTVEDFPLDPIVPFGKPVHDRLRLEIARGCSRGCRFCQAGMIYRPVRERSLDDILSITRASLKSTGYSDISLLSLSTGDYSNLTRLIQQLFAMSQGECNAVSLPSIRAERLTPELMDIIRRVRKTGFTIAPEAGTQRLRDIINKNLTEESITAAVENAFALGWKNIKLYFMMGLPFEEMADIEGICSLAKRLSSAHAKGKKMINVSVASFIPKAHTPFQRHAQISLEQGLEKLSYLKANLRHPKVNLKWQDPKMSLLEGVFARGDRRLSKLLVAAFEKGCRLDGWSDQFNFNLWQEAFEETGIDPDFYTTRNRSLTEPKPWDHIDSGVDPQFFETEFQKAVDMALTPDCREGGCTGCGVCDFKQIRPVLHKAVDKDGSPPPVPETGPREPDLTDNDFIKYEVLFSKLENARFFGHLELATIFQRALKRTGFKVKYSKGFNPSMRMAFETALPLGMESEQEKMTVFLEKGLKPKEIQQQLNQTLPEGLAVMGCRHASKSETVSNEATAYEVKFSSACLTQPMIDRFLALDQFIVEDLTKKGKIRRTDIRKFTASIFLTDENTAVMKLLTIGQRTLRPARILLEGIGLNETMVLPARIKKLLPAAIHATG